MGFFPYLICKCLSGWAEIISTNYRTKQKKTNDKFFICFLFLTSPRKHTVRHRNKPLSQLTAVLKRTLLLLFSNFYKRFGPLCSSHCDFNSAWTFPSYSIPVRGCSVDQFLTCSNKKVKKTWCFCFTWCISSLSHMHPFVQCYFTDIANALISTCPFKPSLTCQYQHTHSHQACLLRGIHLNASKGFAMHFNLCSLLCLLSSHHQVWHMISQITKVLLEFSGGGIGFFVVHFSIMIARGIQMQDSTRRQSCTNCQLTWKMTVTRNCKT